jgi:hypothetical protein
MSSDSVSPSPQPESEEAYHNTVLTRTHEPARSGNHSWLMIIPLVVVVVAGGAFWFYVNGHPSGPIVNHAVAAASDKPAWQ